MKKLNKTKGFTLVELLVVISVIAMLIGILMPALNKAKAMATRVNCKSNLKQIAVALRIYLDDNRDIMPPACMRPSINPENKPTIMSFLFDKQSIQKVFKCPGDKLKDFEIQKTSYEYNERLGGQSLGKLFLSNRFDEKNLHVMRDFDAFHGPQRKLGSLNYLYADCHIGDRSKQE